MMLTLAAIVQCLVALAAQVVLMRLLQPKDFGQFALVLAGCGLVQMLLSLRLNVQIIRAQDHVLDMETCELYHSALCWETLGAAVVTLIWLSLAGLVSAMSLTLVVALALGQWVNQALSFWERSMPYGRLSAVETGSQMLGHGSAVIMVLLDFGVMALPLRELVVVAAKTVALFGMGAVRFSRWRRVSRTEWKRLFVETRDVWTDGVVEGGFSRIVVLASGLVGGLHGAGIFSQAMRLALVPHQFLSPVVNRLFGNLFARMEDGGERRLMLWRAMRWTAFGLIAAGVLTVMLADSVVPMLFGRHWSEAAHVLVAMTGLIVFYSLFELLRGYCLSMRLTRYVLIARALQYGAFCGGAAYTLGGGDIKDLAVMLSLSYMVVFAAVAVPLARSSR